MKMEEEKARAEAEERKRKRAAQLKRRERIAQWRQQIETLQPVSEEDKAARMFQSVFRGPSRRGGSGRAAPPYPPLPSSHAPYSSPSILACTLSPLPSGACPTGTCPSSEARRGWRGPQPLQPL